MNTFISRCRYAWVGLFAFVVMGLNAMAADPTDVTGVITELGNYKTAAIVVGIALLLWVLGKRVVKRFL